MKSRSSTMNHTAKICSTGPRRSSRRRSGSTSQARLRSPRQDSRRTMAYPRVVALRFDGGHPWRARCRSRYWSSSAAWRTCVSRSAWQTRSRSSSSRRCDPTLCSSFEKMRVWGPVLKRKPERSLHVCSEPHSATRKLAILQAAFRRAQASWISVASALPHET